MFVAYKTLRLNVQIVLDRKASFIAFAHVGRLDEKKKKRGKEKEKKNLKQMSKRERGGKFQMGQVSADGRDGRSCFGKLCKTKLDRFAAKESMTSLGQTHAPEVEESVQVVFSQINLVFAPMQD